MPVLIDDLSLLTTRCANHLNSFRFRMARRGSPQILNLD
jgi:hypothetical protein